MNNGSQEDCVFVVVSQSWYLPVCSLVDSMLCLTNRHICYNLRNSLKPESDLDPSLLAGGCFYNARLVWTHRQVVQTRPALKKSTGM